MDFEGGRRDGWEINWPISYADLKPYYDQVDQLIGVCGGDDDSEVLPGSKFHQPPPGPRCGERFIAAGAAKLGIPDGDRPPRQHDEAHRGFPPCHYCGKCGGGCDTASFFNSADHLLPFALKTGKLELRSQRGGRARARWTTGAGQRRAVLRPADRRRAATSTARWSWWARAAWTPRASCSTRSRERHPNGLGNGSDVIGRYLCEQIRLHARGFLPQLFGTKPRNDRGIGGEHVYMPRFNHLPGHKRDYLRGFGMQFWNTGSSPDGASHFAPALPGFGAGFKADVKRRYPSWFELHPFGEVLPYAHNRITVDEKKTDRYGVPLAHIDYRIGENERKMAEHMADTARGDGAPARAARWSSYKRGELDFMGSAIHEHGTCRMGDDPKRSALNKFNQMHEVKNVFVVDGSSFPTPREKNPTLTILAVSWRATDYLADQIRQGNL